MGGYCPVRRKAREDLQMAGRGTAGPWGYPYARADPGPGSVLPGHSAYWRTNRLHPKGFQGVIKAFSGAIAGGRGGSGD